MGSTYLGDWSYEQIAGECSQAYNAYRRSLNARYEAYFQANPALAGSHPQKAASLEQAMPPGMEWLAEKIPPGVRHRHHCSGKSSQALGLGLLGAACLRDPSLRWYEAVLAPVVPFSPLEAPTASFEFELDPNVLNEHPRVTAVDFLVETRDAVICTEIKWAEQGLGRCSCGASNPAIANCSSKVRGRSAYWDVARDIFLLPDRVAGKPCPISAGYQAIRNAAAAIALAKDRQPVFVLLYDADNPYFRETNDWPGWPEVLRKTLHSADLNGFLQFRAISWQEFLPQLPLSEIERRWAREKHELGSLEASADD